MYGLVYVTDALGHPGSYLTVQKAILFIDHEHLLYSTTFIEYSLFFKDQIYNDTDV